MLITGASEIIGSLALINCLAPPDIEQVFSALRKKNAVQKLFLISDKAPPILIKLTLAENHIERNG